MSETLTFDNGAEAIIYGSLAGALSYLGAITTEWDDVETDESLQRLLVRAGRYLDRLPWTSDYATFAARDALDLGTGGGDAAFPFRAASYELANAALDDEALLSGASSGSSDVSSMTAGSASISMRSVRSDQQSAISRLPDSVTALIGTYLDLTNAVAAEGGTGDNGSCVNPFGPRRDFDRTEPF